MSATRDRLLFWLVHQHGFALEVPFRGVSGKRRYRWDAAKGPVAVEYQGKGPDHAAVGQGLTRDYDKIAQGQLCGFVVIPCDSEMVNDGRCMVYVEAALERVSNSSAINATEDASC